jgi:hypothetical protein
MTHNSNHVNFPTRHLRPRHAEHTLLIEAFEALAEWETFDDSELEVYQSWMDREAIALS